MRVFIFGIGGTGSKVLRALTMLLASGVKLDSEDLTVIPIVIDTDAHNGNTAKTRDLLRSYHAIRNTFVSKTANSKSNTFFNTQIRAFNKLDSGAGDAADLDVQLNFQNKQNTFADFINYRYLNQENRDIMELLYSDSMDDYRELHLDLTVGFKGNPNIGSVVFNGLMDSQQYKNLENSFLATDRVFIISSIFGGTGSSGFPTLVKLMRSSINENLKNAKIGALTMMPYYNVENKDKGAIRPEFWDTKTKAALSFYDEDSHINSVNAMYYMADKEASGSLKYSEGGADQITPGHLVELLGASAIIDFINKSNDELSTAKVYEFGTNSGENPFTIAQFGNETKENCIKPMTRFAYAAQIATSFIPKLHKETFYKPNELNIEGALGIPNEYNKLIEFFKEFKAWTEKEMANKDNGRTFSSYSFDSDSNLNTIVQGKYIKTSWLNSGLTSSKIGKRLTEIALKEPKDLSVPQKYLNTLFKVSDSCMDDLGQMP
jgi:hypothetical protein